MADKINQGATEKVNSGSASLNQGAWQSTSVAITAGLGIKSIRNKGPRSKFGLSNVIGRHTRSVG